MGLKTSQRQLVAEIKPTDGITVGTKTVGLHGTTMAPKFATGSDSYYFTQVSGGEITASVEKVYSGGSSKPEVLCAPMEIGDITVTSNYEDSGTIFDNIAAIRESVGAMYFDITVYILDCGLKNPKSARYYSKALLVGVTEPEGDASSGAPTTFALTFAITNVSGSATPATAPTI